MQFKSVVVISCFWFVAVFCFPVSAQIDAQFTQYYNARTYYNAAAVGCGEYIDLHAASRLQWMGIDDAPVSYVVAADMPLPLFGRRVGAGLVVSRESAGLYSTTGLEVQGAWKFKVGHGSFGIGAALGVIDQGFKGSEIELPDDSDNDTPGGIDEGLPTRDLRGTAFDFSLGIFYDSRYFWGGVSMAHITRPTIDMSVEASDNENYEFSVGRMLYLMCGGNIPISNSLFEIQPSLFIKSDADFTTAEATCRLRYNRLLTVGAAYRHDDALSLILGIEWHGFQVGYSYDYSTSAIAKASSGSHELWLGYKVKLSTGSKNKYRYKSIRFM